MIDDIDRQILTILQQDARTPNAAIARQVGMAPSAIFERVRKLEERGILRGFNARVEPAALGLPLLAFVFVRTEERPGAPETATVLSRVPGVQEVHQVAGEDCLLVKLRASDPESLGRILREQVGAIDTVRSTRTTVVLHTVLETAVLPLDPVAPHRPAAPAAPGAHADASRTAPDAATSNASRVGR
ncbi:MAG TPA: Lrp/AsnC family transcriptional regulator [Gemmatimonadaceae bacterium]|nr:Lrp/AsnC family transcriptional regulator [Gemmatimonadaceae bacterium]